MSTYRPIRFGDYAVNSQTNTKHYITRINPVNSTVSLYGHKGKLTTKDGIYYDRDGVVFTFQANEISYIERDWTNLNRNNLQQNILNKVLLRKISGDLYPLRGDLVLSYYHDIKIIDTVNNVKISKKHLPNTPEFVMTDTKGNVVMIMHHSIKTNNLGVYDLTTRSETPISSLQFPYLNQLRIIWARDDDIAIVKEKDIWIVNIYTHEVLSYHQSSHKYIESNICTLRGINHTEKILAVNLDKFNDPYIKSISLEESDIWNVATTLLEILMAQARRSYVQHMTMYYSSAVSVYMTFIPVNYYIFYLSKTKDYLALSSYVMDR